MKSSKARKQRKAFFNAPLHQRRKQISSHLEENLLLKYDKRRIPLVKGDTVKVMRGVFKGHENKVSSIHLKKHLVEVEGVTLTKADGKQIAKPVHPSNLLITKLNLTDKWRRQRLEEGLSTEAKKEIEQEATVQIKELEEERKAEEERRKQEEEAAAKEEEAEETVEEVAEEEKEETIKEPATSKKKTASKEKKDSTSSEKTTEKAKETPKPKDEKKSKAAKGSKKEEKQESTKKDAKEEEQAETEEKNTDTNKEEEEKK